MTRIGFLPRNRRLTWKYALLGGLASIPVTLASYWQTGDRMSLSSVLLAAVIVGYLAKRRGLESSPVGARTGLVGSLPVALILGDVFGAISALSGPPWFRLTASALTIAALTAFLMMAVGLSVLFGWIGGRIGGWLAERLDRKGLPVVGN